MIWTSTCQQEIHGYVKYDEAEVDRLAIMPDVFPETR